MQHNILNLFIQFNEVQEPWLFQYNKNEVHFYHSQCFLHAFLQIYFSIVTSHTLKYFLS